MNGATPPTGALANLDIQDDNQNNEAASPNATMVDAPEEHIVEANGTEAEDVAIINPDNMDTDTPLLATDRASSFPSFPLSTGPRANSP
jgi:hypothetical protein